MKIQKVNRKLYDEKLTFLCKRYESPKVYQTDNFVIKRMDLSSLKTLTLESLRIQIIKSENILEDLQKLQVHNDVVCDLISTAKPQKSFIKIVQDENKFKIYRNKEGNVVGKFRGNKIRLFQTFKEAEKFRHSFCDSEEYEELKKENLEYEKLYGKEYAELKWMFVASGTLDFQETEVLEECAIFLALNPRLKFRLTLSLEYKKIPQTTLFLSVRPKGDFKFETKEIYRFIPDCQNLLREIVDSRKK